MDGARRREVIDEEPHLWANLIEEKAQGRNENLTALRED